MELKKLKNNTIKEIILMTLTYRVSYKNLAKIFAEDIDEIKSLFAKFPDLSYAFYLLDRETMYEDEINEKSAYVYAMNYLKKRRNIIKELKAAKLENNHEKLNMKTQELHEHFLLVDDTIALGTIGRRLNELTQEELESISRYRLKYGLSMNDCMRIFRRDKDTLIRLEKELAEKNPLFNEKIDILNNHWYEKHMEFSTFCARNKR